MFKRILVAVDDSSPAVRAVDVAVGMAQQLGAQLAAVHVVDWARAFVPELAIVDQAKMTALRGEGVTVLQQACVRIPPELLDDGFLREGDPAETILATAAEWDADLIVIGSDSRGRLAHFLLGSTADSVIRKASCPVIAVRADAVVQVAAADQITAADGALTVPADA
jgi:nucleotide-binding universal stress UspA family protein